MIALVASIALVNSTPSVSVASRGETVGALLAEVSRQTGVTLEAMPQTKSEVVLVSVKGVTLDVFETRLAESIGARWLQQGAVKRLGRPLDLEKAQMAAERRLRIKEVTAGIEALRLKLASQPTFDEKVAKTLAIDAYTLVTKYKGHLGDSPGLEALMAKETGSPGGRLAIAAAASLSPEQIADIQPGGRIVYSSDPTPVQRPVPEAVYPAVKRYLVEQQIFAQELKKQPDSGKWAYVSSPLMNLKTPETPSGIMFSTERSPYNPSLTIRMELVKKDGTYAAEINTLLDIPTFEAKEPDLGEGTIDMSPQSSRLAAALKGLQDGKSLFVDPAVQAELIHPEKIDPLSYVVADGLFALAKQDNFIACVPDDGFMETLVSVETPDGKIDLKKYSHWLTGTCEVHRTEGWMTVMPRRPVETRTDRVDRDIVGAFFRAANQSDGATLEEMAEFADKVPRNYDDTIVPFLAFFDYPELNAGINDRNIELLRVFGRLSPDQKALLEKQKPLTIDSLDPESLADLNYLVYRADSPVSIEMRQVGPEPTMSVAQEITVALPSGVPPKASLSLSGQSSDAVLMDGGASSFSPYQPMTAWNLGYAISHAKIADPTDKREQIHVEKYRFGHTRHLNFILGLTDTVSINADFHESKFPRKGASVSFDQLPASFQQAVAAAEKQALKQMTDTGQRQAPPPP